MILHCPKCGRQHIDKPEIPELDRAGLPVDPASEWMNPPHRSHLCHGCGFIWRPADVCTNGVAQIQSRGKDDSDYPEAAANALSIDAHRWRGLPGYIEEFQIDYVELVSKIDADLKP